MNRWVMEAGAILLVVAVAAGWHYRSTVLAWVNPPASGANPSATPDVLYTWVDRDGVTHFDTEPGPGRQQVAYDGSRITPIDPVSAPALSSLAGSAESGAVPGEERKGGQFIHAIRDDIQKNRDKIEKGKMVAAGLEDPDAVQAQ